MVKTWWKNLYRWYDAEAHDGGQNKVNLNSGFVQRWVGSDEESEVKIAGKTNIRSVFTNEATTFQDVPFAKLCLWNDQSCLWNEWTAYILLLPAVLAQAEMEWVNLLKCSFLQSYGIIKVVHYDQSNPSIKIIFHRLLDLEHAAMTPSINSSTRTIIQQPCSTIIIEIHAESSIDMCSQLNEEYVLPVRIKWARDVS